MMSIAGVILAGGASRRFGTDKAAALVGGRLMIACVAERLAPQVEAVAIAGASQTYGLPYPLLDDAPYPSKGPLAGLLAGLKWAIAGGYSHVVTVPCDVPELPRNLVELFGRRGGAHAVVLKSRQKLEAACALWPVTLVSQVTDRLEAGRSLSLTGMLEAAEARTVLVSDDVLDGSFANINTPSDLAAL